MRFFTRPAPTVLPCARRGGLVSRDLQHALGKIQRGNAAHMGRMEQRRTARTTADFQHIHIRPEQRSRHLQLALVSGLVSDWIAGIFVGNTIPEPNRGCHVHRLPLR